MKHSIRFGGILLCAVVQWLAAAAGSAGQAQDNRAPFAARIAPGSEDSVVVVFVTRIMNGGEAVLRSPKIHMYTPAALPHQAVTTLEVEANPERLTDRWGSRVLYYHREALEAGKTMTGRWIAQASIRRFQWDLNTKPKTAGPSLTPAERELYLRDTDNFMLNDPVVRQAASQAAQGRQEPLAVLDGIFGLVMERLTYERDGKWAKVPAVLTSGKGSCSEFSYCFIAMCRQQQIPARYVGGIVGRSGVPFHLDKVFHRFPQAFVPGIGWVDFDPTRTDRANNKRLYFGQTPGPMLLLCIGDGAEGSYTGADYLEAHAWEGKPAKVSSLRQAWWFPPPPANIRKQVADFREQLAAAPVERKKEFVAAALRLAHPFVLPWLDDLLYEPAARVEAARACLKLGGQGELAAVINGLARLNDEAGDLAIAQILEQFTGEKFGNDRTKWNEWLKTRTPRTPLPGDAPERRP